MSIKPIENLRSIRQTTEIDQRPVTASSLKEDYPRTLAKEYMIPHIIERTKHAIAVDRRKCYYYKRLLHGRRCSCFTYESEPEGACPICFTVGIAGGYEKYGCRTEVIDHSANNLSLIGIRPAYEMNHRPVLFQLMEGVTLGSIFCSIKIWPNAAILDNYRLGFNKQEGGYAVYIKRPNESSYVEFTKSNLEQRLNESKLDIRIDLMRNKIHQKSPLFSHILLRYQILKDILVNADVPRKEDSNTLAQLGWFGAVSMENFVLDSTIKNVAKEDILYRLEDQSYWKIITLQTNRPLEVHTSYDLQCKLVQPYEGYQLIPL